jgi:hypothetical protein
LLHRSPTIGVPGRNALALLSSKEPNAKCTLYQPATLSLPCHAVRSKNIPCFIRNMFNLLARQTVPVSVEIVGVSGRCRNRPVNLITIDVTPATGRSMPISWQVGNIVIAVGRGIGCSGSRS